MGFWVANTLSPRQKARFIVYSWPYYPLCSALAEASVMLQPTKGAASDNGDAEQLERFMRWRCSGMRAECDWLVGQAESLSREGRQS
jgi:hypothetical protein